MLTAKDGDSKLGDPIIGLGMSQPITNSTSSNNNNNNSVPWMEFLNKPSFWSLIIAHVCQNNAYYILLTWLPTYFQENYPGSKVSLILIMFRLFYSKLNLKILNPNLRVGYLMSYRG